MNDTLLLLGSLSNDLARVANSTYHGSPSVTRFLLEANRWASQLKNTPLPPHIQKVVSDITSATPDLARAERYLMYSVILQNYCLHAS